MLIRNIWLNVTLFYTFIFLSYIQNGFFVLIFELYGVAMFTIYLPNFLCRNFYLIQTEQKHMSSKWLKDLTLLHSSQNLKSGHRHLTWSCHLRMEEKKLQVIICKIATLTFPLSYHSKLTNFVLCEALLKLEGLNVKGLMKAAPAKEEPQSYIDCTGNLQVFCTFYISFIFCISSFLCLNHFCTSVLWVIF